MIAWGINALNHGSSLAVFRDGCLISNKADIKDEIGSETIRRALDVGAPDHIYWYEQPWLKKVRQLRAGQWSRAFDLSVLPSRYLKTISVQYAPVTYTPHHASHAAAGYYTAPFDDCAVVVLDAIGEFESASIWHGCNGKLTKLWSRCYPHSLGLFYSAFTQTLGLTPVVEEGTLQRMAADGDPARFYHQVTKYFTGTVELGYNFHQGVRDQQFDLESIRDECDLAAAVQLVFEQQVDAVMALAQQLTHSDRLVYMGGCAMNSKYNQRLSQQWSKTWSLPQPGDASSSIGAVLYHSQQRQLNYNFGVAKHLQISV